MSNLGVQPATVRTAPLIAAAQALGWAGDMRWPVDFGGVRFAAVGTVDEPWEPGDSCFSGCIVSRGSHRRALSEASLLAGYSSRAVLVPATVDAVDLVLQAAFLDQGAVLYDGLSVDLVASPGPVVPSLLQWRRRWATDERWLRFCKAVLGTDVLPTAG